MLAKGEQVLQREEETSRIRHRNADDELEKAYLFSSIDSQIYWSFDISSVVFPTPHTSEIKLEVKKIWRSATREHSKQNDII